MNYGITVLEKLLARIETMSVSEYEKLYDEATQPIYVRSDYFNGQEYNVHFDSNTGIVSEEYKNKNEYNMTSIDSILCKVQNVDSNDKFSSADILDIAS